MTSSCFIRHGHAESRACAACLPLCPGQSGIIHHSLQSPAIDHRSGVSWDVLSADSR
jgi:hypothetical protein